MTFLNFLYRNGLWISVPLFGISVVILVFFILSVIRLGAKKQFLSVPLLEKQNVEFAGADRVVLCVEGPLFTSRFAGLTYELIDADNTRVKSRTSWFHARSSSFSKVRMEMRSFEIPKPGRYILRIQGLDGSQAGDSKHRIVFMRPYLVQTIGYVLGIVLAAWFLIGCLVLSILRIISKGAGV
jgi:hypothetical protein